MDRRFSNFARILSLAIAVVILLLGNVFSLQAQSAQEIQFVERYALSEDREATLKELVPGTENYYYFHCLHYLTTEQWAKAEEMLKPWMKRFGRSNRASLIENRLAILKYGDDPDSTLAFLKRKLNLNHNHQREIPQTQRDLPTKLDPSLIDLDRRIKAVLNSRRTDRFTELGLPYLADKNLTKEQRRHLLGRLTTPDFPGLVDLILTDLKEADSKGFGRINIHNQLTLKQLDECAKRNPKLLSNNSFVDIYASKLFPNNDINWKENPTEHRAYLDRLWKFVGPLDAKFNSLKACILFRQLELDRSEGKYDLDKFTSYLKMPRRLSYVNPRMLRGVSSEKFVNLGADFSGRIRLVPIGTDEELIQDYLQHFFKNAENESQFASYVRTEFLKVQFAAAKILNGLGDAERWASYLSPSQYQTLMERVDLDFVRNNSSYFQVNENVELELYTKNVKNLIVKIFEINTFNYYRKHGREIDTNINLDGLVPNEELTFKYDEAPAIRVKRKFSFDQLNRPGVFVVDFIGNGKSSRALIRKGRLNVVGDVTVAGHRFRVIDETGRQQKEANIWVSGRRYSTDNDGQIIIPFSNSPGNRNAIITSNRFSCLRRFKHQAETYDLRAAIQVDRESLLRSNMTDIAIRPRLLIAGIPTTTDILKDVELIVNTTNLDGISSTKRFSGLQLSSEMETLVEFLVPPRLSSIQFELTASVRNISKIKDEYLSVSKSLTVNAIDSSDEIQDLHLAPTQDGYVLEVLGKSGESRAKQGVRLSVRLDGFKEHIDIDLQSDANGQIHLGPLAHVNHIKATLTGGSTRAWVLRDSRQTYYGSLHASAGETIRLPLPQALQSSDRSRFSLLEVRHGKFTHDRSQQLSIENGQLVITDLARGDYRLRMNALKRWINIRVTEGKEFKTTLLGKNRHLEKRGGKPSFIQDVSAEEETLEIKIGNVNPWTRIHVFGTRYVPRFDSYGQFSAITDVEPMVYSPPVRKSVYLAGRKIGDEYQYILDRKYAQKYPGNLLERPSLLLNPWELRSTENKIEQLQGGADYGGVGNAADQQGDRAQAKREGGAGESDFANLDFLNAGTAIINNVKPDKNGVVTIKREILGDAQHIRVVVLDAFTSSEHVLNLPLQDRKIRDLRMVNAMDPEKHFSQRKQVDVLNAGEEFVINDILSAKFRHYDDLGDVFKLLNSLNEGKLDEFKFILNWPDYADEKKQELYSKYACHELNFFLYKKDRAFFDNVVSTHLEFKRNKTFVDRWLLGDNLDDLNDPWRYRELNTFERILLSQRLEEFQSDIARNVSESYLLNPTKRDVNAWYFDSGLEALSWDEEDGEMEKFSKRKSTLLNDKKRSLGKSFRSLSLKQGVLDSATEDLSRVAAEPPVQLGLRFERDASGRTRAPSGGAIAFNAPSAKPSRGRVARGVIAGGRVLEMNESNVANFNRFNEDSFGLQLGEKLAWKRAEGQQLYRRIGATKEWVENNYWKLPPDRRTADHVLINQFWRDYANHEGGPFLSPNFAEAHRSLTESMIALAVIDLPFKGPEHQFVYNDATMKMTPAGQTIVLHQQVRPAAFDRQNTRILVSENFFQKNDRYLFKNGVQYDKFVSDEFTAHTLYGAQVVITNPTSTPQAIDLLMQIPAGAVVAGGSQETRTMPLELAAFSTTTHEYYFYFPTAGDFTHFPAHVSSDETVLAVADPVEFKVTDTPSEVDKSSWAYVSQNGTESDVIEFLNKNNILRLDLGKIAFRMKDKTFYRLAIETLKNRFAYNHTLWSYSILHNDKDSIREYLQHADSLVNGCGSNFQSDLLNTEPLERRWYFHSEFWPLINSRTHRVGANRKILNPEFHQQYHKLMNVLANEQELDDENYLAVTYYMLLQDRIEEALAYFAKIDADRIEEKMQYDYCDAYLDFYLEKPASAASKASKWVEYPVTHWRKRFQEIVAQVEEINGGENQVVDGNSQKQNQDKLAMTAPSFNFEIESNEAKLVYQNVSDLVVNYYEMDIELLFSRRPFAQDELDGFSMIKPNLSRTVKLPELQPGKSGEHSFGFPKELANKNVLVEIVAGDQAKSQPYFANSLKVQTIESYGQLRVAKSGSGDSISKAYIKVYSKSSDGSTRFHKDGYTDLRGRFDYVSQSNNTLDNIVQYSILVMHPEFGSVIQQVAPPTE